MYSAAGEVFLELRPLLPGLQALVILGAAGELLGSASAAPSFNAENFASEHATLLRIAQHTLLDTGMGDLQEQILISTAALIVLQRLNSDRFAVLVFPPDEPIGRLRFELKRCLLYSQLSNL